MKFTAVLALAICITSGCSQKKNESSGLANSLYPKDAATIATNSDYVPAYQGEKSGITYYLRRVTREEANQLPEDKVIFGDKVSIVYVAVKDGKIVSATPDDRMILGYKAAEQMAK